MWKQLCCPPHSMQLCSFQLMNQAFRYSHWNGSTSLMHIHKDLQSFTCIWQCYVEISTKISVSLSLLYKHKGKLFNWFFITISFYQSLHENLLLFHIKSLYTHNAFIFKKFIYRFLLWAMQHLEQKTRFGMEYAITTTINKREIIKL